jgi:hypothetical protein
VKRHRLNPEQHVIGQENAAARRARRSRAHRPNDRLERGDLQRAAERYAAAHGPYEAFGVLSLEAARYAPDVGAPRAEARTAAERLFKRGGE